jgi:glyoxylase-like metal-dependent hydrolase (beta-lactamase superfamily II)
MRSITRVAPDVGWLPISFVNVYFIGRPGGPWVLVDAGLPGTAPQIRAAAAARYGSTSRPEAIILTHGHFDHVGAAKRLADEWHVPIYAHELEHPYLTGRSSYPPPDPTIGGAIAFLSRFTPSGPYDFGLRLRALMPKQVPGLPDWEWIATPGHSPGHISLFRSTDRVLLAGDAFATMDMDSWPGLITGRQRLSRAGAPFISDWQATRSSIELLAKLRPNVVGCGHGIPISEHDIANRLARFAERFRPPRHGRYVREPATTDQDGVVALPRPRFDPVPFATAAALLVTGVVLGAGWFEEDRR